MQAPPATASAVRRKPDGRREPAKRGPDAPLTSPGRPCSASAPDIPLSSLHSPLSTLHSQKGVPGGKDVPAGGACPAPTEEGIFAAIPEQSEHTTRFVGRNCTPYKFLLQFRG